MTTKASPKNKRLELGERSKETILDVAGRLMSARGYEGTSISAIAKESGLPASSIYWHFSSKVGVLTAVMDRGNARFHAEVSTMEIPSEGSRFDKILATLQQGIRSLEQNPDFVRLQIILMLNSPAGEVNESVLRMRVQARDGMRAALAQAFADLGTSRAETVAAGLADFVGASFEGIFLAREASSSRTQDLLRQLALATVALAEGLLSSEAESAGGS
ncbi:TetR/AcrR family transcriptional regulator [Streptomyces tendae]|uniref:TetR/AcrR family transcriptional regulator n=1 Tax=Streptomyces tendae TaxID=1932 RepID=UPI00371B2602